MNRAWKELVASRWKKIKLFFVGFEMISILLGSSTSVLKTGYCGKDNNKDNNSNNSVAKRCKQHHERQHKLRYNSKDNSLDSNIQD